MNAKFLVRRTRIGQDATKICKYLPGEIALSPNELAQDRDFCLSKLITKAVNESMSGYIATMSSNIFLS